MGKYLLKTNVNSTYVIISKYLSLDDNDFTYRESGDDISIESYIGNDTDVTVLSGGEDIYALARPPESYTLTINPTPSEATVILTSPQATQEGNSIVVKDESIVNYTISNPGYYTKTGEVRVINDKTLSIELDLPSTYTNIDDYTYSFDTTDLLLTKYIGSGTNITIPGIQGE